MVNQLLIATLIGILLGFLGLFLLFKKKYVFGVICICLVCGLLILIAPYVLILFHGGPIGPTQSRCNYKVAGDYFVHRSSSHIIRITKEGIKEPKIPPKVQEVAWDKRFVLAKQQHLKRRAPNDTYMIPVENAFSYWILDTSIPKAYGPLDENEFKKLRTSLSISESLILKDVCPNESN